jgi:hypothetical protein
MLDALWTSVVLFLIPSLRFPMLIKRIVWDNSVICQAMCWTAGAFGTQFVPLEMKAYNMRFLILGLS